ncbi:hypothetical protein BC830DRAFT_1132560 [Chytriomyces sp. MP71]|nr:hypothetical protein BC830DRAFT_1132560 [Chytriomyces sp. MP71]
MDFVAISVACKRLLTSFALGTFSAIPDSAQWHDLQYLASVDTSDSCGELLRTNLIALQAESRDESAPTPERNARIARFVSLILRAAGDAQCVSISMNDTTPRAPDRRKGILPKRVSSLTLCEDMDREDVTMEVRVIPSCTTECEKDLEAAVSSMKKLKSVLLRVFDDLHIEEWSCKGHESMSMSLAGKLCNEAESLCRFLEHVENYQNEGIMSRHDPVVVNIMTQTEEDLVEAPLNPPARATNVDHSKYTIGMDFMQSFSDIGKEWGLNLSDEIATTLSTQPLVDASSASIASENDITCHNSVSAEDATFPDFHPSRMHLTPEAQTKSNRNSHQFEKEERKSILLQLNQLSSFKNSLKRLVQTVMKELKVTFESSLISMHTIFQDQLTSAHHLSRGRTLLNAQKEQLKSSQTALQSRLETFHALARQLRSDFSRACVSMEREVLVPCVQEDARAIECGMHRFRRQCEDLHAWLQEVKGEWKKCWEKELNAVIEEQTFVRNVEDWIEGVCEGAGEGFEIVQSVFRMIERVCDGAHGDVDGFLINYVPKGEADMDTVHRSVLDEIAIVLAMDTAGDGVRNERRCNAIDSATKVQTLRMECNQLAKVKQFELELKLKVASFFPDFVE